jgi:hypothetical protein
MKSNNHSEETNVKKLSLTELAQADVAADGNRHPFSYYALQRCILESNLLEFMQQVKPAM